MLVAAPPARGAPRTQLGLVLLLLCGLLLLRHQRSPPPVRELWKRDCERKRRAFSTRYSHCRTSPFSVKGARRATDMRETLAEELAMRRIVQPSRRAAWMRQRNEHHAVLHARTAHGVFEWNLSPEPVDGEAAEKKDHPRLEEREFLVEPRTAERNLGGRLPAIATSRRLSGKALRDRGPVREMILVDPRLGKPAPELGAGATAERLTGRELDGARCLADDRDAVANGSRNDRPGTLEEARVDAFRARTNPRVEPSENVFAVSAGDANDACQLVDYRSGWRDSNPRPPEPHSGTLPGCATPRKSDLPM